MSDDEVVIIPEEQILGSGRAQRSDAWRILEVLLRIEKFLKEIPRDGRGRIIVATMEDRSG